MAAPPKVFRGQAITQAQMDSLAAHASAKIASGKPYFFPVPVIWQVPDRATMLKFDLADWGVTPGGIVIVKDERKAYQFNRRVAQAGKKSWELIDNWEHLTNWHIADHYRPTGAFDPIPFNRNLVTLTGAAVGDIAALISPLSRGTRPPEQDLVSPEFWQLYKSPANDLSSWRHLGSAQEVGWPQFSLTPFSAGGPLLQPDPIWTRTLVEIQTDAIAKLSSNGRLWKPIFGTRRLPFADVSDRAFAAANLRNFAGLPANNRESCLWVNRVGPLMPSLPQDQPDAAHRVRIYKEIEYFARGDSQVMVNVYAAGSLNWKQGGQTGGDMASPNGCAFNANILDATDVDIVSSKLSFLVTVFLFDWRTVEWTDSTGLGAPAFGTSTRTSWGTWPADGIAPEIFKPWSGGSFDVSATLTAGPGTNGIINVGYYFHWQIVCNINRISNSKHKTAEVRRGRLPDVALEVPGFNTPLGNVMETGRIACIPVSGDLEGAYIAKGPASLSLFQGPLKHPWATWNVPNNWTIIPYPCHKWTDPPAPNPNRWTIGSDIAGNAVLYDVYVLRTSIDPPRLVYPNSQLLVAIGVNVGGVFQTITVVSIAAGQAGARISAAGLNQIVIMDNEPLYYRALGTGGGTVSCVQIMAIKRRSLFGAPNFSPIDPRTLYPVGPFDFRGAQFGFLEHYNETIDLLEAI